MQTANCPQCGNAMDIPSQYIGREIKCVHCGSSFITTMGPTPSGIKSPSTASKNASGATKQCPYCAGLIQKNARICKHCKADLSGGITKNRNNSNQGGNFFSIKSIIWPIVGAFIILIILFVSNFHIITGENVGFKICRRNSFSFSEFMIKEPGRKALPRRGEFRLCSGGAGRCVSLCWFLAYRQ